ncbi:MAG: penicillin-binding protein 2 [Chromatiales bacterium]|nr:penicillin-binding protein 2 [Chromatiales bacterium]
MNTKHSRRKEPFNFNNFWRRMFLAVLFSIAALGLIGRAIYLQNDPRLAQENKDNSRYLRTVEVPAYRGSITDRHGTLLAISAPVYAASIDLLRFNDKHINEIAEALDIEESKLRTKIMDAKGREFLYLKRHINPQVAEQIDFLKVDGLHLDQVYKRFYPAGEIAAHVVGLTDVDGIGIEGMEMNTDEYLRAVPGSKQIMVDAKKRTMRTVKLIDAPRNGKTVALSIDQRIQYYAYRALRNAIAKYNAESGSVVVVNAQSGEIIVAVNYPSFNPNDHRYEFADRHRNRMVTDTFELGSTVKPMVVAAGIDSGALEEDLVIDTNPGYIRLSSGKEIKDIRNYGELDITDIIVKSSNIGISKIVQKISSEVLWNYLKNIGFGEIPGTIFPGEGIGKLRHYANWSPTDHQVISYGYGVSASPLQLAIAYTAFANDGWQPNPTFIKDNPYFTKRQVFAPATAKLVRKMLRKVVSEEGTGKLAKIKGFTTAGKTGTVRKSTNDQGDDNEYTSMFAGFAPIQQPNFVCVVIIDKPRGDDYYGGVVAAPVFADIMAATLRFMNFKYDESMTFDISKASSSLAH